MGPGEAPASGLLRTPGGSHRQGSGLQAVPVLPSPSRLEGASASRRLARTRRPRGCAQASETRPSPPLAWGQAARAPLEGQSNPGREVLALRVLLEMRNEPVRSGRCENQNQSSSQG